MLHEIGKDAADIEHGKRRQHGADHGEGQIIEKGGKTDWTWFYKITNDGYTMGTNRKEQKGNQLVECLSLYHEFVKHGKKPEETKNQFCIPSEWVKTLDPRIKEKIRTETRADMEAKGKIEKSKIVGKATAEKAVSNNISNVVFDRNGYLYHGRVKALADGAREGGLKF